MPVADTSVVGIEGYLFHPYVGWKLQKLNFMERSDFNGISEVVKELFGKSD